MGQPPDSVRRYFEARAAALTGDVWRLVGPGNELDELPAPAYGPAPAGVREACGYYDLNVVQRDNGSLYVFRANADGTPVFGVLTTSDGGDYWLELYGADGALLGAARMDSGFILWRDRDAVRRKIWDGELEPELLAARERRLGS